jgi:hypothetical protein
VNGLVTDHARHGDDGIFAVLKSVDRETDERAAAGLSWLDCKTWPDRRLRRRLGGSGGGRFSSLCGWTPRGLTDCRGNGREDGNG